MPIPFSEALCDFAVTVSDAGTLFSLDAAGERACNARLDQLESQLMATKPETIADVLEALAFVERCVEKGTRAEIAAAVLANCREFLGRAG